MIKYPDPLGFGYLDPLVMKGYLEPKQGEPTQTKKTQRVRVGSPCLGSKSLDASRDSAPLKRNPSVLERSPWPRL